jgi:rubrerythrin
VTELLYQALETEKGGIQVYKTAIRCAQNSDLKEEWTEYLEQTENHERILTDVCTAFGLDPEKETPGRKVVRPHRPVPGQGHGDGTASPGPPEAAELVAAECVVLAESKDHLNWELIGQCIEKLSGAQKKALKDAHEEVEEQEDEHLYHTQGWARELWIQSLGMKAVIPPPEEEKDVKTAIGAARAKQSRKEML